MALFKSNDEKILYKNLAFETEVNMQNLLINIDLQVKLFVRVCLSFFVKVYKYKFVSADKACIFIGQETSELGATIPTKSTAPFVYCCKNILWYCEGHAANMATSE